MANNFSIRTRPPSGRVKIVDVDVPGTYSVSLITVSSASATPEWEIYFDKDINELPIPDQPSLTTFTTGGSIPRNTPVYVRVTTVDANGVEGPPSHGGKSVTTGSGTDTNTVRVTTSAVSGTVSYRIYAGTKPNALTFFAETTDLVYTITTTPVNGAFGIPTSADIVCLGKKDGVEPLPLGGTSLVISRRLIVYCTVAATSDCAFTMLVG